MQLEEVPSSVLEVAEQWLGEWARLWKLPKRETPITVEFSNRLRSSLGRSYPQRGLIRLHTQLCSSDNEGKEKVALREVLCHEAAHIAVFSIHGSDARPHGAEWQNLVRLAGFEPRVRAVSDVSPAVARDAGETILPVEHRCPVCHAVRFGRRRMRSWRCAECVSVGLDGVMSIVQQPRRKRAHHE